MGISGKQKVYIAVLGVAGAGLIIDQAFLQPQQAAANSTDEYSISGGGGADEIAIASDTSPALALSSALQPGGGAGNILVARLESLSLKRQIDPSAAINAFDSAWRKVEVALPQAEQEQANLSEGAAERFEAENVLTAVIGSGPSGCAVVNRTFLKIGDSIAGFKLVSVVGRAAIFRHDLGPAEGGSLARLQIKSHVVNKPGSLVKE